MSFRIATFNIQFGQMWCDKDPDGAEVNLRNTLAAMKDVAADIYLLQEVEFVADPTCQPDPPPNLQKIKQAFPEYEVHFSYPPLDERELPFGYGQCILSRFPLKERSVTYLPAPDIVFDFFGKETSPAPRVMVAAQAEIEGRLLQLYDVHLQAVFMLRNKNSDHYLGQRNIVEQYMRESTLPTIIGGDFNVSPAEGTVRQLESAGYRTMQNTTPTWKRRPYVTDHIFYNDALQLGEYHIIPTPASDHSLLYGDFTWSDDQL